MTIEKAIQQADALVPNGYSKEMKKQWLSTVESLIYREILQTHENAPEYRAIDKNTPNSEELYVYAPYDELYVFWLKSKINMANSEYNEYNNAATSYNELFQAFRNNYNREHKPLTSGIIYY